MNKLNDIKWKYLAGLISESEYFEGLESFGKEEIKQEEFNPDTEVDDFDSDDDLVDLDLDDNFDYKYNTFEEFINSKYGNDLSLEEKVRAIEEWAAGYNVGENPGDFSGIAEIMTPELFNSLNTSSVSQIFIDELEKEINYLKNNN